MSEKIIGDFYKVDLFMPNLNMIIEVQGPYHFNGLGQLRKRDLTRRRVFKELGYRYCEISRDAYLKLIDEQLKTDFLKNRVSVNLMWLN